MSTTASSASFVMVGERTNVTGSARFRKLIREGDYAAALAVVAPKMLVKLEFVVLADFGQALGHPFFLAPEDVGDGQRQDPLSRFLESRVKDLLHGMARNKRCH